ncbi:MAG TPA: tetratricopeptide repeat protein [Vicinamibacterales bacterium]|nr:tetratricopeptide repeat protein [Vicinamibacterales bacterium]
MAASRPRPRDGRQVVAPHAGRGQPRQLIIVRMQGPQGDSLKALLNGKPLPPEQILDLGCQIAGALEATHARGAVHGDIKPVNVGLSDAGQVTLLDTREPSINYMSPELIRREPVDVRTDLFSVGAVLYEMTTGRQAFGGQTVEEVSDAILHRDPLPIREINRAVPAELDHVITRALEKDRAMRYQTAADLQSELTRLRRTSTGAATTVTPLPPAKRKLNPLLIVLPLLAILAAGGYFFWRSSQPPDFNERDTIVVADVENTTGDPVFDDGLRQVVLVQFQQSPYVTLLADQSVLRHLRIMSRNPDEPLTGETVREVCKRAGGKASVEGSIAPQGSNYVIAIGVHNCQTGEPLATAQVQASSKEDVLNQIGAAIVTLRKRLGEPGASIEKYNVKVTEATSGSLEALKAYGQALKVRQTRGDEASMPLLERAIQLDPNFALAYARLGAANSNLGRVEAAKANTQKAYGLRDRVTEYERLYITWSYAQRVTQNMAQARTTMEMMTTSYPRDFAVRNNLGVVFMGQGLYEDALKAYMVAQEIAPDEPLPVSNSAYALLFLARHDEAFAMVDRALALRPDPSLAITRWVVARVQGHARAAEFEATARTLATAPQMLFAESNLAVWEGRLADYSGIVEKLREEVRASPDAGALQGLDAAEIITMAVIQGGAWVSKLNALARQPLPPAGLAQVASALAIIGQMDTVRALAPQLDQADLSDPQQAQPLMVARALLAGSSGQVKEAEAMIASYLSAHPRALDLHYYLGKVREQNGMVDEAIESYRKAAASVNILGPSPAVAGAKLSLALLLKKKGDTAGATALFDELLKQWANADADFEPLKTVHQNK